VASLDGAEWSEGRLGGEGASSGVARPGNSDPLYPVVSITHTNGVPGGGLVATDFRVVPIIVAAGGALATISRVVEAQPGVYLVEVVPIQGATWQLGRYIFWIAVTSGSHQGQTLERVFVH